jgi:hypothetical protein
MSTNPKDDLFSPYATPHDQCMLTTHMQKRPAIRRHYARPKLTRKHGRAARGRGGLSRCGSRPWLAIIRDELSGRKAYSKNSGRLEATEAQGLRPLALPLPLPCAHRSRPMPGLSRGASWSVAPWSSVQNHTNKK